VGVKVLCRVVLDLQKTAKNVHQQIPMLKKVTQVFEDVSIAETGACCIDFTI